MKTKNKINGYILRWSAAALLFSGVVVALSATISLPNHTSKVPASQDNPAFGANGHGSGAPVDAPATQRDRTLTLADRVAYQRAIEEVYWRHRIWPDANAGSKPPLDKVMSQAQIEKKVEDYLRNSQALEDYWRKPITPDQLQAEMERMASHTKQPGVLREIFAALGNDPFVIAECLARPLLAERLLTQLYTHDQRFHGELKRRAEGELKTHRSVNQMKQTSGLYTEVEWIKSDSAETGSAPVDTKNVQAVRMNGSEWQEGVEKLAAQFDSQGIVGQAPRLPNGRSAAGAAALQKPAVAQIKTGVLSPLQEDDAHYYAVAVMNKGKDRLKLATVAWLKEPLRSWVSRAETQIPVRMAAAITANYTLPTIGGPSVDCTDDTWTATSITNAPDARKGHTAVWTGSEMIVWGGDDNVVWLNTGGRYNPTTDSWTATTIDNAPEPRSFHTAVWTGSEMIVWGGVHAGYVNTGGRYNPSTDTWTATSTTNAPEPRYSVPNSYAVWSGSEMIVWGGTDDTFDYNTGGKYNPSADSWTATSTTNAPVARSSHTVVWTGSQMIVWGGKDLSGITFNTGGKYNPGTDSWTATSTTNAPAARDYHTAVWTGSEMIIWGGSPGSGITFNTGGKYNPDADSWTATSTTNAPIGRFYHTAVWTDSQMIVWGGFDGVPVNTNTGGRYNPTTDSWTATSLTNAPTVRELHTAVWTSSQMIVWGGIDDSNAVLNTGGRYCAQGGPSPTPTSTPTPTAMATATATATATTTPSATPTATPTHTPTATPTATATATPTATPTPTPTPTPCTGRCTPTPRPRPTPAPRPTP